MSDLLADLLGIDLNDAETQRALQLAEADLELLRQLRHVRKQRDMTQKQVADRMGVKQPTVASFEAPGNDPRLSTVRRYAQAVGALVRHDVAVDEGQLQDHRRSQWVKMESTSVKVGLSRPFAKSRRDFALAA